MENATPLKIAKLNAKKLHTIQHKVALARLMAAQSQKKPTKKLILKKLTGTLACQKASSNALSAPLGSSNLIKLNVRNVQTVIQIVYHVQSSDVPIAKTISTEKTASA